MRTINVKENIAKLNKMIHNNTQLHPQSSIIHVREGLLHSMEDYYLTRNSGEITSEHLTHKVYVFCKRQTDTNRFLIEFKLEFYRVEGNESSYDESCVDIVGLEEVFGKDAIWCLTHFDESIEVPFLFDFTL